MVAVPAPLVRGLKRDELRTGKYRRGASRSTRPARQGIETILYFRPPCSIISGRSTRPARQGIETSFTFHTHESIEMSQYPPRSSGD